MQHVNVEEDDDTQWAPISDLMAVLMLVFMLITAHFIGTVVNEKDIFKQKCDEIHQALVEHFIWGEEFTGDKKRFKGDFIYTDYNQNPDREKFKGDFIGWQVDFLEDSTIRFRNPEVLFLKGSYKISPKFEEILSNFFPRYMRLIRRFQEDIKEIRIEGHTSSEYDFIEKDEDAYIKNMRLSQDRTVEILKHVLSLEGAGEYVEWAKPLITANGLSSSRLRKNDEGEEDKTLSRRVEFRLLASSCQKAGVYENQN